MSRISRAELAFQHFVSMGGGRSLAALAAGLRAEVGSSGLRRAPSLRSLEAWSSKYHWQARIADLDRRAQVEFEAQHIEMLRRLREEMAERGRLLVEHGVSWISERDASTVSARDAIKAVEVGLKLQEIALGGTPALAESHDDNQNFAAEVTDDELESIIANARQVRVGAPRSPGPEAS